jgi:hypothetical protein
MKYKQNYRKATLVSHSGSIITHRTICSESYVESTNFYMYSYRLLYFLTKSSNIFEKAYSKSVHTLHEHTCRWTVMTYRESLFWFSQMKYAFLMVKCLLVGLSSIFYIHHELLLSELTRFINAKGTERYLCPACCGTVMGPCTCWSSR